MSSPDMQDPSIPAGAGGSGLRGDFVLESSADHLRDEHRRRATICREAILTGRALHHVAHYVNRMYEFAVDVLADPALSEEVTDAPLDRVRIACLQAGQELCYQMVCLDQDLQQLQSGALIRIVLHGTKGAIVCNSVIPGACIVAVTLDRSATSRPELPLTRAQAVQDADRAAAGIVNSIRDEVSLGTQNPGGWSTTRPSDDHPALGAAVPDTSQPTILEVAGWKDRPLREACRATLSTADLHYVAHFHQNESEFSVDCLDDRALTRFFLLSSSSARRKFYDGLGRQFTVLARQLFQIVCPIIGGPLSRIVLDNEQGAIYFYRLTAEDHLLGVTLDQRRVGHADDKMAQLAISARKKLEFQ